MPLTAKPGFPGRTILPFTCALRAKIREATESIFGMSEQTKDNTSTSPIIVIENLGKKFMQMIGLSPDDNIRLDDPLYELKLLQSRLRKVKKECDKHKDDFGFILTPLYREYNQLVYDERKLRMQIIMDSPPTKWEFMCVERFPLWMEAERIRYLDAIKRENEILKMGRQHSLDLENPEYIAAMIDGEDVY